MRIAAVAATSLFTNVPLGAWREHLVKFSPAWFVAVHASIPLVIMMRKSVLLPKTAIIATIGCAILGQFYGSRLERRRVASVASRREEEAAAAEASSASSRGARGGGATAKSLPLPLPNGLRPALVTAASESCGALEQISMFLNRTKVLCAS